MSPSAQDPQDGGKPAPPPLTTRKRWLIVLLVVAPNVLIWTLMAMLALGAFK